MKSLGPPRAGTSLLELIISLALMAVISTLASDYFRRSAAADYEQRARARAVGKMELTFKAISRDLERRVMPKSGVLPSICGSSLCTSFRYERVAKSKSGAENARYGMQWTSYCQTFPSGTAAYFEAIGKKLDLSGRGIDAAIAKSSPQYPRCMRMLNCGYGQYPQIIRHVMDDQKASYDNSRVPPYPFTLLPANNQRKEMGDDVVAAAICVDGSNPKTDRIMIETAVLNEERLLRFERKEVLFPVKSVSNLQILSE